MVLVVGAGIVGVSQALSLARRGVKVTLIDALGVGRGTSWGWCSPSEWRKSCRATGITAFHSPERRLPPRHCDGSGISSANSSVVAMTRTSRRCERWQRTAPT